MLTVAPTATLISAENVSTVPMPSKELYASPALVPIIKISITWEEIMTCKGGRPKTSENGAATLAITNISINKMCNHSVGLLQETIRMIEEEIIGMGEDRPDEQEAQETIETTPSPVKIQSRC